MIEIHEKREIWDHVTFIYRGYGIELGKIRVYFVFCQVGILDTSKYSTWNSKVEKNVKSESESRIIFDHSESFIFRVDGIELGKNTKLLSYRIFPSRNFRHFEILDLEREKWEELIRIENYFRPIRELYFEI